MGRSASGSSRASSSGGRRCARPPAFVRSGARSSARSSFLARLGKLTTTSLRPLSPRQLTDDDKKAHAAALTAVHGHQRDWRLDAETFYKVPWMDVPDLVGQRRVVVSAGFALVSDKDQLSLVLREFEQRLERALEVRRPLARPPLAHGARATRLHALPLTPPSPSIPHHSKRQSTCPGSTRTRACSRSSRTCRSRTSRAAPRPTTRLTASQATPRTA